MLHVENINKKLVLLLFVVLIFLVVCFYFIYVLNVKTFYKGIYIDGTDISGLSINRAKLLLESGALENYDNQEFIIRYGELSWKLTSKDIELALNEDESLNLAYMIGRKGNILNRLNQIISLRFNSINIKPVIKYKTEKVRILLQNIKNQIDRPEKNAAINFENGEISFEHEVVGLHVPIDKNIQLVENRIIEKKFGTIALFVEEKTPEISYNDIKNIDGVISSFKTNFNPLDENRSHNIRLGCERIDRTILMPNDIFSMNQSLGPRTLKNGYREAPVIFKNELVPGTGGGVCQITSTLYNTVLLSKNDVIQRTHHSWPLGYVEPGRDATIAEDYIDFKFQNTTGYPIAIKTRVTGGTLEIIMLGKKINKDLIVRLKNEIIEVYQPEEEIVIDNSVPDYEKIVVRKARTGMKVLLFRETYDKKGELLNKEKISEDIYKPVNGQIKVNENYKYLSDQNAAS